jgi:nucleoside-diphosphate-sugar epimerase
LNGKRILYIGGSGTISASCVRQTVAEGAEVYVLNRGTNARQRPLPDAVRHLQADLADSASVIEAMGDLHFDSVADFISFNAADAIRAVELFTGRTEQYVQISTASMYRKPILQWPVLESTPRHNPFVRYSRDKIEAEDVVMRAFVADGFPVTVVRPSHTYDEAQPPLPGDWTAVDRILRGAEIVVPGDGTSLWTLTHSDDFAVGFVGLLANPRTIGESFHITSDDLYTWDQIYAIVAKALGREAKLVHVPSELILAGAPDWFWSELIIGDLAHSAVFDNSKVRRYVPEFGPTIGFEVGAEQIARWQREHPEASRPDPKTDGVMDRLVEGYRGARRIFEDLGKAAATDGA